MDISDEIPWIHFEQIWEIWTSENSDVQRRLKKCSKPLALLVCAVSTRQGTRESSACRIGCIGFQSVFVVHITTAFMLLMTEEEDALLWI